MSPQKIGRNERCWCESGKKFKHCHLDRANQRPLEPWQAFNIYKQAHSNGICLAPDSWLSACSGKIAKAHTVPKSSSLKLIARNGHVSSFNPANHPFDENGQLKNPQEVRPELWSINKASTFSGFCSRHDDAIFAPLEKQAFSGTPEQCFLLGYRAMTRELYAKHAAIRNLNLLRDEADKGKPFEVQMAI